jgi:ADP-heptose:LPS heptosyltransferase
MLRQLALSTLVHLARALPAVPAGTRRDRRLALRESSKALRRELRRLASSGLRRISHPRPFPGRLASEGIRRVLVCRLNGRLGNTLLLTPLLKRLHESLPDATIDLALSYPQARELFGQLPGVGRIISFPHKDPRAVWRFPAALAALRAARYDLAIDPVPESTSGRIALALCRARHRLGYDTATQWVRLSHAVPRPEAVLHHGVEPVYLLERGLAAPNVAAAPPALWLPLEAAEVAAGRALVARALPAGAGGRADTREPIGFFANATGAKRLGSAWWLEFWSAFLEAEPGVAPLEFLPYTGSPRTDARFPGVHVGSLRELAAAIGATRLFIAPDAGPMHLASATPTPTVALFCASDPTRYRPMKPFDLAIDVSRCSARDAAQRCREWWRARTP